MTGSGHFHKPEASRQEIIRATIAGVKPSSGTGQYISSSRDSGITPGDRNMKDILDFEPVLRPDSRQRILKDIVSTSPIQFGSNVASFNQYLLESKSSPKEGSHRRITSHGEDSALQRLSSVNNESATYKAKISELMTEKGTNNV